MGQRRSIRYDAAQEARAIRFATELADTLHELGITHKELAQQMGVTVYAVDSWTRGVDPAIPGKQNLDRLCAHLEARQSGTGQDVAKAAGHQWAVVGTPTNPASPSPTLPVAKEAPTSNLPYALNSFIGREQEIEAVGRLLSTTRLLTLAGAGGIGKTRLALELAGGLLFAFPDGVWLVELASLSDPALVLQLVATTLGVREQPGVALAVSLREYLRHKHSLLILDNCEHLIEECALLASSLLQSCAHLKILATSREALRVPGETIWRVPPLSVPDAQVPLPPEDLSRCEAVRLFVERARSHQLGFRLDTANAAAVTQVCRRLDGIPLALELAAGNMRFLSVEQIAKRLDDRFSLLGPGSRGVLPRHQTLRATIDWSYGLLTEEECVLFRRLSVFAGKWTLEVAEAVCTGGSLQESSVLELMRHLADKSLVIVEESKEAQYRMLETIREYAWERASEEGEGEELRSRHATYYVKLAKLSEAELRGPDQLQQLERLEWEHDNLRAALRWLCDRGEVEAGLRFAGGIWRFWYIRGYIREGRNWLEELLHIVEKNSGDNIIEYSAISSTSEEYKLAVAYGKGLHAAGSLAMVQGDYEQATALLEKSIGLHRELKDKQGITESLVSLARIIYGHSEYQQAKIMLEESLHLMRELENNWGIAHVLSNLGVLVCRQGDNTRAIALLEESIALFRTLGARDALAGTLADLGIVWLAAKDHQKARLCFMEGLVLMVEVGQKNGIAWCMRGLAGASALACAQDSSEDPVGGVILLAASDALLEAVGAVFRPLDQSDHAHALAELRARLDEESFAVAWKRGRAMTSEQAIAYALDKPDAVIQTIDDR